MSRHKAPPKSERDRFVVSDGISKGEKWATYSRTQSGSLYRIVSPALPLRDTKEEAEGDLLRWLGEETA